MNERSFGETISGSFLPPTLRLFNVLVGLAAKMVLAPFSLGQNGQKKS